MNPPVPPKETLSKTIAQTVHTEDTQMGWIYREMTIKTTARRVKPERLAKPGLGKGVQLLKRLHIGGKCVICKPLWKTVWWFLIK